MTAVQRGSAGPRIRSRWRALSRQLYFWVLVAVLAGALLGLLAPGVGEALKPAGDIFISLIKMIITPIVFVTVVLGISSATSLRKVGRVGVKALVYFQCMTLLALTLGLVVADVFQPGAGLNIDPATLSGQDLPPADETPSGVGGLLESIVPDSVVGAFADGNILQVLVFAILFGVALTLLGERGATLRTGLESVQHVFFTILRVVMYFAPVGAFGAVAFTTGKYGAETLGRLGALMACFYLTCVLFVFGGLALVLRLCGISLWRLLRYFRQELLVVLATTSTETVLPQSMDKLQRIGCGRSVVNLTIPSGYSFNLDGAAIYLTMTSLFIAQALDIPLTLGDQLLLLGVLVISAKGGAGVAGAALAVLAATLSAVPTIPVAGIALIIGIDRFMNEARALTNLIGNLVATIVVSRWERDFDVQRARAVLSGARPGEV
ncbi:C4-dicarboxylate transporter DctA [Prauserella flavalba]|uniref:C4-dicarboxylate transporter DctA n=1 Tax=Prauserella flavalba TaxID=1477506 RepID=A0A318LPB4_9PSEU|nr:C4-dicarboxylate transporter DctA [Prauserella flavalba]PXY34059.1 C4-dicarboxylate transporter DctA [Prauserella flavalba]